MNSHEEMSPPRHQLECDKPLLRIEEYRVKRFGPAVAYQLRHEVRDHVSGDARTPFRHWREHQVEVALPDGTKQCVDPDVAVYRA